MNNVKETTSPGAINIINASVINHKGQGVNLRNVLVSLTIHEDIMTPFITGKLIINDANSIAELLPFMGEEMLILDVETPRFGTAEAITKKYIFHIYKMEGNESVALKNNLVGLCFTSIEAFTDINVKISRTFRGKISDTVKSILKTNTGLNTFKEIAVEETSNSEFYTSNLWSPAQNLMFLTGRAMNDISQPNYVFFENNDGFVFASLSTLYQIPSMQTFVKDSKTRKSHEGRILSEDYGAVLDMSTPVFFDYIERVQTGFYGAEVYSYDFHSKRFNHRNFITAKKLKTPMLNKFKAFDDQVIQFRPEAAVSLNLFNRELYNGSPNLPLDHLPRRIAHLSALNSHVTNVQVFGRLDYSVGKPVDLVVYSNFEVDAKTPDDELLDETQTGKYLITAVQHNITRNSHMCNLELSKDSMIKDIYK